MAAHLSEKHPCCSPVAVVSSCSNFSHTTQEKNLLLEATLFDTAHTYTLVGVSRKALARAAACYVVS